jgi:hypothetical protein
MPRFAFLAADFAASNSNRIWYRNYTTMGYQMARAGLFAPPFKETVYDVAKSTG